MGCEELERGYAWCYETLFSHRSIWKRRPTDRDAVLAYLAMSYLYKRSNRFWHLEAFDRALAAAVPETALDAPGRPNTLFSTYLTEVI